MKNRYTVIIYTPQELNHSSYIQTGLFELKKEGFIDVKIYFSLKKRKGRYIIDKDSGFKTNNDLHPKTSYYKVIDHTTKEVINFACDLYDLSNQFSSYALNECDYIFKRNYEQNVINRLPEEYHHKVLKLGLTFGVHSEHHRGLNMFKIINFLGSIYWNTKFDSNLFKRIFKSIKKSNNHWMHIKTTRKLSLFDNYESNKGLDKTILFQTRCFPHEDAVDVQQIHTQRYEIIKFLRKEFPENYIGGFVNSNIVEKKYCDAISNISSEPVKYLAAVKKSSIVIYTRGLENSPAWKMAEYCSQGKIIVAEKLTTELPERLIERKQVVYFNDKKELYNKINVVFLDNTLREQLSENSRLYYENHIHPKQNMLRILKIMGCEI